MGCDQSPQDVEIEITQEHPALRLHELRQAAQDQRLARLWSGVWEELLQWNLEDVRDAEGDFDRRRVFVNFDDDLAGNGVQAIRLVHNAEP